MSVFPSFTDLSPIRYPVDAFFGSALRKVVVKEQPPSCEGASSKHRSVKLQDYRD